VKTPILELTNVSARYGNVPILKDISLEVFSEEIVAALGANGAGKSTLLNVICGIHSEMGGIVVFQGKRIDKLPPEKIVKNGISQCPEGRRVFPEMTTWENIIIGSQIRRDKEKIMTDVERMYSLFPVLKERKDQLAGTLSGGEQQMLAIARSLMSKPVLLLLDEPSMGIAPIVVKAIYQIIKELRDAGTTVLLVEQNVRKALNLSDRGYVIETGKIVLEGASRELLSNEKVKQAYLGR